MVISKFKLKMLLILIFISLPLIKSYSSNYSFLLNKFTSIEKNFSIQFNYTLNNVDNSLILFRHLDTWEKPILGNRIFYQFNIKFSYHKYFFEIGRYYKNTPYDGVVIGKWNDDGTPILGYDESKVKIYPIKSTYFSLGTVVYSNKYYNFVLALSHIPYLKGEGSPISYLYFSKSFSSWKYSLGIEVITPFFKIPTPSNPFLSISYRYNRFLELFFETKYNSFTHGNQYVPGLIGIVGISSNLISNFNLSIFYHTIYNKQNNIPYNRIQNRFGLGMKLFF